MKMTMKKKMLVALAVVPVLVGLVALSISVADVFNYVDADGQVKTLDREAGVTPGGGSLAASNESANGTIDAIVANYSQTGC